MGFWRQWYDNIRKLDELMENWGFKYVGMIVLGLVLAIPILLLTAWQCMGRRDV